MAKHLFIVQTNCVEGQDAAFNDWYTNRHIPDVLKIPGVVAAQRFVLSDKQRKDPPFPWRYLAIYEVETDDLDGVINYLKTKSGTEVMPRSPALDPNTSAYFYHAITERAEKVR